MEIANILEVIDDFAKIKIYRDHIDDDANGIPHEYPELLFEGTRSDMDDSQWLPFYKHNKNRSPFDWLYDDVDYINTEVSEDGDPVIIFYLSPYIRVSKEVYDKYLKHRKDSYDAD